MRRPKIKLLSLLFALVIASAASSGFLVGRTLKLHKEGKLEQMQQVGEQVVDVSTAVQRGLTVAKQLILR